MRIIFDFGNARGKWFVPKKNLYGDFLHAVYQLTSDQWSKAVGRGRPPKGYLKVNGVPYAVGDAARMYVLRERPKGAARYNELYYGAGAALAMAEGIGKSCKVQMWCSHAPQDADYAADIVAIMRKKWVIESATGVMEFEVESVNTFDEPLGGAAHFSFNEDGTERKINPLSGKRGLIVDVGGHSCDRAVIEAGRIDPLSVDSVIIGTLEAVTRFEKALKSRYKREFQSTTTNLDIQRVEAALVKGFYQFGNKELDCKDEAKAALSTLVNDVIQVIKDAGGAANFDVILLTGGGAALIYDLLVESFPQITFLMAEKTRALMKYANVFGGAKIATLVRRIAHA